MRSAQRSEDRFARRPPSRWRIALEVTNLTDELYYHSIRDDRTSSLTVQGMPAPLRRWALAVRRNF
jgi:iron complex outermembrane receptor protein